MKHIVDVESLTLAERLLNSPLPFPELPDTAELLAALNTIKSDEAYSIKHCPPLPLWTVVGNAQVQTYYHSHPKHPRANDHNARARRRAAFLVLNFARNAPSTFTMPHMESLHVCLFDCDVSIRHDLVKAIGAIKSPTSAAALAEIIKLEPESEMVLAMATFIYNALTQAG